MRLKCQKLATKIIKISMCIIMDYFQTCMRILFYFSKTISTKKFVNSFVVLLLAYLLNLFQFLCSGYYDPSMNGIYKNILHMHYLDPSLYKTIRFQAMLL